MKSFKDKAKLFLTITIVKAKGITCPKGLVETVFDILKKLFFFSSQLRVGHDAELTGFGIFLTGIIFMVT